MLAGQVAAAWKVVMPIIEAREAGEPLVFRIVSRLARGKKRLRDCIHWKEPSISFFSLQLEALEAFRNIC